MLVMSDRAIHTFDAKKGKLKFSLPFTELKGVSVSELFDGLCVLHTSGELKGDKGDMLFDTPHVIEFIAHLNRELILTKQKNPELPEIPVSIKKEITHMRVGGKESVIHFKTDNIAEKLGPYTVVPIDGRKSLLVVSPAMEDQSDFQSQVVTSSRMRSQ